jgi:hypothetical protein
MRGVSSWCPAAGCRSPRRCSETSHRSERDLNVMIVRCRVRSISGSGPLGYSASDMPTVLENTDAAPYDHREGPVEATPTGLGSSKTTPRDLQERWANAVTPVALGIVGCLCAALAVTTYWSALDSPSRILIPAIVVGSALLLFSVYKTSPTRDGLVISAVSVVGFTVIPAVYTHTATDNAKAEREAKEAGAERAATTDQLSKLATTFASMRSNLAIFMSDCSPAAFRHSKNGSHQPTASGYSEYLSSGKCATRYEAVVRDWVEATWTYRLRMPAFQAPLGHGLVAASTKDALPAVKTCDEVCQAAAIKILVQEGTDTVSEYYRELLNTRVSCCTDWHEVRAFGEALRAFYLSSRRFGCALMYAPRDAIKPSAFDPNGCYEYLHRPARPRCTADLRLRSERMSLRVDAWWDLPQLSECPEAPTPGP